MTLDGTNTWILRAPGASSAVVIDPGPLDDAHLADIAAFGPVSSILITHGHHDHVEGAAKLSRLLGGAPVRAAAAEHCVNAEPLQPGLLTDAGLDIEVLAAPGHTADSVCFVTPEAVFTGDTILGRGTTVVAWPDGDLGAYLTTLEQLSAYDGMVLPGHGPVLPNCAAIARTQRLEQVRAAVAAGATTAEEVVRVVYPDIDPAVRFAAEWSARAQLEHLSKSRESQSGPEQLDPL
jgi:glyoxylase-like metal-dependent hydrolase (beta-lactamase superfamily II)